MTTNQPAPSSPVMDPHRNLEAFVDPIYFNGLLTAALTVSYYVLYSQSSVKHAADRRFYLFMSLGWAVNLAYLAISIILGDAVGSIAHRLLIIHMNLISHTFFLGAASTAIDGNIKRRHMLAGLIVVNVLFASVWLAPQSIEYVTGLHVATVLYCSVSALVTALAIRSVLNQRVHPVPSSAIVFLVVSFAAYGLLQLAAIPSLEHLSALFFSLGAATKLAQLIGLFMLFRTLMGEYAVMVDRLTEFNRSASLVRANRQLLRTLVHEITDPAAVLRLRLSTASLPPHTLKELYGLVNRITGPIDTYFAKTTLELDTIDAVVKTPVSLNRIADEAIAHIREAFDPEVKFVTAYTHGVVAICSYQQIFQVIRNVLKNAVESINEDAREASGRHRRDGGEITLRSYVDDSGGRPMAVLTITDDGPGIAPESAARIFEEGYSTKTTKRMLVRGFGLAVALELAKANQGSLRVHSLKPATFVLALPHQS